VTFIDGVAYMLHKIADHALLARDCVDSEKVKGMWLEAALETSNEKDRLYNDPSLNLIGNSDYSIFQHLENQSSVEIVDKCLCGIFYHRDYVLPVKSLEQIEILGTPQRLNEAKMPFCLKCNRLRVLVDLLPIRNWLLVFKCEFNPPSPNLSDIPQILTIGSDLFKLEYITYTQDAPPKKHQVSLQFIRYNWYVFDSDRSPKFYRWFSNSYTYRNAELSHIVYFKC